MVDALLPADGGGALQLGEAHGQPQQSQRRHRNEDVVVVFVDKAYDRLHRRLLFFTGGVKKRSRPLRWDESVQTLRGATQFQPPCGPFCSCYGERAVDVSIPARLLSWPVLPRCAFSRRRTSLLAALRGLLLQSQRGHSL